jgi:hypothetical protein
MSDGNMVIVGDLLIGDPEVKTNNSRSHDLIG